MIFVVNCASNEADWQTVSYLRCGAADWALPLAHPVSATWGTMPFAKEQKSDEQLPAAAAARPPTPTAASRLKQLRPGMSKSFGSLFSKVGVKRAPPGCLTSTLVPVCNCGGCC